MKRTSTKSFQIELGTKYDTNDAKRKVWWGVQICEEGVHICWQIWTLGPNPRGVEIRCCDTSKTLAQIK